MRIASNQLKDLKDYFITELKSQYPETEINSIFKLVADQHLGKWSLSDRLSESQVLKIYDACKRLQNAEPVQYILRTAFFYKHNFYVSPDVLIPRPETEELVDLILKDNLDSNTTYSVIDFGTGSGCIPISLQLEWPRASIEAVDISEKALSVAMKNAEALKVPVKFIQDSILEIKKQYSMYDIVVSNPPYIKISEKGLMHKNVIEHEPHLALFVDGEDAIVFYKRIIDFCEAHLKPGGKLYFELNPLTSGQVLNYAMQSGTFTDAELMKDMSGKSRFLKAVK